MKRLIHHPRRLFALLLVGLAFGLLGCAGPEPENASARPWNSPTGWQSGGGLPGTMNEGR
jgi:hypothetical protein